MDFALDRDENGLPQASLGPADELANAVILSLLVRRGSFFIDPNFGSRLHEITTLSDSNVVLSRQYAAECLDWLRTTNRVSRIVVSASRAPGGRLNITVTLARRGIGDVIYETFFKVG